MERRKFIIAASGLVSGIAGCLQNAENNPQTQGGEDYSDLRAQMAYFVFGSGVQTGENQIVPGANVLFKSSIEPLAGAGGLSDTEIAELVYLETQATIEPETAEYGDQEVASNTEFRGVVGINLSGDRSAFPRDFPGYSDGTVIENNGYNTGREPFAASTSLTDNAFLQQFSIQNVTPFYNAADGYGGGSTDHFVAEKNYTDITTRGRVLDPKDEIDVLAALISDETIVPIQGIVRLHMMWDVGRNE